VGLDGGEGGWGIEMAGWKANEGRWKGGKWMRVGERV
jgi:hypothetical protein